MFATIVASVKFWPEIRTAPCCVLLPRDVFELPPPPHPARTRAPAAIAAARSRRFSMESTFCVPRRYGARVRCPPSCKGVEQPSCSNRGQGASLLPRRRLPCGVGRALRDRRGHFEHER